ncbi:unnamed protein product [Trichobilharzia szidati]|nr:unnamed protein product [Trichobilharzia szidati]
MPTNSQEFMRILSQYDALCLRAAHCLLLSGSGLPEAYRKAGQLTCWRNLAGTLPLGLTMIKSKKELFYIIIQSIIQNNNSNNNKSNEDYNNNNICNLIKEQLMNNNMENNLPNIILDKLHHILLTSGLNELGLSVVISVLGKLASYECRPRIVYYSNNNNNNTLYRYELPDEEAVLIQCILRIIFGLSVYHRPQDVINVKTGGGSGGGGGSGSRGKINSKSISLLSLLPISPKCGCKQLTEITSKHPQICLRLLFNLITESAVDITVNPTLTTKLHNRITQLNLCLTDQYMGVEEILFQLVNEAPFHIMQPDKKELEFLINSVCQYPPDSFLHKLCRLILSRFSWDAYQDVQSGEPFIPFPLHLNMALGLCEIVDKHLSNMPHFNIYRLINPILASNIYQSAKSSVNLLAYNLTDQFLSALLTSQRRLRIKSSGVQAPANNQSELSRRTYSVENISTSPSSTSSSSSLITEL